jgi:hypothetical protein
MPTHTKRVVKAEWDANQRWLIWYVYLGLSEGVVSPTRPKHCSATTSAAKSAMPIVKWSVKNGRSELMGHNASR